MTPIGERLRRERLRRNLDLDHVSRELKISSRFLEAIEAERFDRLPGGVFARSFVRQYAHLLGLDEEEAAAAVRGALEPEPDIPKFAQPPRNDASAIHVPPMEAWDAVSGRGFQGSSWLPALAMVVVVMVVCSGIYALLQRTHHAPPVAQAARVSETPAPKVAPAPDPIETAAPSAPTPTPAESTPAPAVHVAAAASPNPDSAVRVQVTADEPVWLLARTDGKYSFSGTLLANESRTVEAANSVELRLGNAGGVTIVLNGKPLGAIGPKGQVRTVQLTSGGFQIVAAPKPSALVDDPL